MKIDSSFVNYWFDTNSIKIGAMSYLCSEYHLSDVEGFSLFHYLLAKETISKDTMEQAVKEWRAAVSEPNYDVDFGGEDYNKLETLLPFLGIEEKYNKNPDAIKTLMALSKNQAKDAGSLMVVITDIVKFFRALKAWKELKIQRYVSRISHPILHLYRKKINSLAFILSKIDRMQRLSDEDTNSVFETILAIVLIKQPTGFNELVRLFYLDGYTFDETSNKECASAVLWLTTIRDFCISDGWDKLVFDILNVIAERNLTTNDPYLDLICGYYSYIKATGYLEDISDEYEVKPTEVLAPREPNTGGREKGTWHSERNELDNAIWTAIFAKIWNGHLKQQIANYYFGDRSPKKVQKEISLLGVAHFYLALEKEGFAKKYGESGTKLSFWETMHNVIDFRRQSLDDYMLLMYLIDQINDVIEQESFNDKLKDKGFEKTDNACEDATSQVVGKMRIVKGDASQIWAVELAKFRKEHYSMYSLLGEDIISANFTVDKELNNYKYNNINKMIKTDSGLRREICRQHQDLTQGQKYSNAPKQAKKEDGS